MHVCSFDDLLSQEEQQFLNELLESGVEEAQEVFVKHQNEFPPSFATNTADEASDYLRILDTARRRVQALERVKIKLERR